MRRATQTPKAQRGQKVPTGDGANSDRKDLWAPKAHLDLSIPGAESALPARLELAPNASKALSDHPAMSDQKRRVSSARPGQLGQKAREALKAMLGKEGRLAVKGREPQQARKVRRGRPVIRGREAILEARRAQAACRAHRARKAYRDQQVLRAIKVRQARRGRRAT